MLDVTIRPSPRMLELYAGALFADIRSYREPMQQAVDEVVQPRIVDNFMNERDAHGNKWAALSDETVKIRGSSHPILRQSNRLFRAATRRRATWTFRGQGDFVQAFISRGELARRVPYATFHQEGTRHMPERPYLNINEADAKRIEEIFGDYLQKREIIAGLGIGWKAFKTNA